jgi:hypothetical protein
MRSMRTGVPLQLSSYRLTSKTYCPSWTISEGIESLAQDKLRSFYNLAGLVWTGVLQTIYRRSLLFVAWPTGSMRARSRVRLNATPQTLEAT